MMFLQKSSIFMEFFANHRYHGGKFPSAVASACLEKLPIANNQGYQIVNLKQVLRTREYATRMWLAH